MYSVAHLPGYSSYFIGKDNNGNACLLIGIPDKASRQHAPIRLENLEVLFEIASTVKRAEQISEETFTVMRCRSVDTEIVRYFLSIIETLLRILGPTPNRVAISDAITRLVDIFRRLESPATRTVNGLFGELFLVRWSQDPFRALAAWRPRDESRFDFNAGRVRVDVKAAGGRQRIHTFSYDQCNPPSGTTAIAASLFVEQVAEGVSLRELIREIEALVATNTDLVLKLHDTVADTLGRSVQDAFSIRFDHLLAASSLQFYDLRAIPALRTDPPPGVSDIHFRSDLSGAPQADVRRLLRKEPSLADFLPES